MKTTYNLLMEAVKMGFDRDYALTSIDASLDDKFGIDNRKPIEEEILEDDLYETIILGFECQKEAW